MLRYVIQRVLTVIPVLLGVSVLVFAFVRLIPCLLYTSPSPRDS